MSIAGTLIWIINLIGSLLILLIILNWIFSFFLDYYNPVRRFVDRIVEPMLMPIRRAIPLIGGFDISYLILILMIYALKGALIAVISSFV